MDNKRHFPLILSSFWLKIIALLTMTIDHIGYQLPTSPVGYPFRIIGRIALPLFVFMVMEGTLHTKSFKKYLLRLGIMASAISIAIIGSTYIPFFRDNGFSMRDEGNIFIDLLLCALAVYCLKQKKWYFKLFSLLPLAFSVASFLAVSFEFCGCFGEIWWMPFFLRTQYGFYAVLLAILFYLATSLTRLFCSYHSGQTGVDIKLYEDSNFARLTQNIFSVIMLVIATLIFYFVVVNLPPQYRFYNVDIGLYALLSGAFILLYSGKRGYNKKWFQYGSYLYYPLHMIVLYLIFMFI